MNDIDQGGYYTFDDKIYVTLNHRTALESTLSKLPSDLLSSVSAQAN